MKYAVLFLAICLTACSGENANLGANAASPVVIKAGTVPATRSTVNSAPAANYSEKVPDELNDWKFSVSLYETKKTFQYLLRVQYKELRITDSIEVPDLGFLPKVALHKGSGPLSCIVGFLDQKENFKEYRLVRVKDEHLKITTLHTYYVGHYTTQVNQ